MENSIEESVICDFALRIDSDAETEPETESESEKNIDTLSDEYTKVLNNLFSLFMRHKWTLIGLEDAAKFVNSIPGSSIQLPSTKYLLLQEYWRHSSIDTYQYFYCETCKAYTKNVFSKKQKRECEKCNNQCEKNNFFVVFGLENQIKSIISKYFDEIIDYRNFVMSQIDITDMYNANHLKSKLNANENIWSLCFNTDGVSIVQSSKTSLWPILFMCNFLPPRLRFKDANIIVAGLYHGLEKPNMYDFCGPMVTEFNYLSSVGIFVKDRIFKIFITAALLDLPAKSILSQIKQYNSYNACNFCQHEGERTTKGVRYTYKWPLTLRTHRSMLEDMKKVQQNPNATFNGVKGISPLVPFEHFDLAKSFPIDYMHAVLLGVTKSLLQFWTETKNKRAPFYITKPKRDILNARLSNIKIPSYINRRPRSLDQLKYFKASEYRSLLLFYLPVCLKNLLPKKYIVHLRTLSSSIYKLLEPKITNEDLDIVERKLLSFAQDYESFYGKSNMTMNVHTLLHLVDCVRDFGPIYCYSMFSFESYNGRLKDFVVAPKDILHQIATRYIGYKSFQMKEIVLNSEIITLKDKINVTFENRHIKAFTEADIEGAAECFTNLTKNGVKFTSKRYKKSEKTADYFVHMTNGIGAVDFYFIYNYKYYAMIENLHVYKTVDQVKRVALTNESKIIQVKEIKDRCIYINLREKMYIVARPNSFERN